MEDKNYPYGYQLSFYERVKLRLKKLNYRLSIGIAITFIVLTVAAASMLKIVPKIQLGIWQNIWITFLFLLVGIQGLIWMITGEIKRHSNITLRGRWVPLVGFILFVFCWSLAFMAVMGIFR